MANIFYLVGASGSGKDSLLDYARTHVKSDTPAIFSHRYITRPEDAGGENHISLAEDEFQLRLKNNCFAMHWYSHDTYYGIGIEIEHWMSSGLNVVMNGSRGYFPEAVKRYPDLVPVLIRVEPEILRHRLQLRGRESDIEIERRLIQARELEQIVIHPKLIKLENNSALDEAGNKFIDIISESRKEQCA